MLERKDIKFDDKGLVPAIVQHWETKEVLTLAYMNAESLRLSMEQGETWFYSRSRQALWHKGATSGHTQRIISITADCDSDALVVVVEPRGPACHTGAESCFSHPVYEAKEGLSSFSLAALYELIAGRKEERREGSYTSYLFEKGLDKILKKVGEESTEVVIAAKNNDRQELLYELGDITYHLLVLMVEMGLSVDEVKAELRRRHVVDKKQKQEYMG